MIEALLEACPEFSPQWIQIQDEWSDANDPPVYLALGAVARYLIARLEAGDEAVLSRAFGVVERWHVDGDVYVKEAATVGLLENLQNLELHESTSPEQFEPFLRPESLKWWRKVERFWSHGELITEP